MAKPIKPAYTPEAPRYRVSPNARSGYAHAPMIRLQKLAKRFGSFEAVRGIDLTALTCHAAHRREHAAWRELVSCQSV